MFKSRFGKLITILIGVIVLTAIFGRANPVFAQQKSGVKNLLITADNVFDTTAQQRDPNLNQQLASADLQKLATPEGIDYETLGFWPGIMRQDDPSFDDHLSFIFTNFNLPAGATFDELNFSHYFSVASNNAGNVKEWFYNIYDQNDNFLGRIDGSILNADGSRQDKFSLGDFSAIPDDITGLRVDFYLLKENETKLFRSNHDYVALEIAYEENAPQVILSAPVDNGSINSNQPHFAWQTSENNLWSKLQIWDSNNNSVFDQNVGQVESYDLTSGLPDGNYKWQVNVSEDSLNWVVQSEIFNFTIDTLMPDAPVIATFEDNGQINVSWNVVEEGAVYEIYRNDLFITTTDLNYFIDQGLEKGQNYTYYVVAIDKAGNRSLPSNAVMVYLPNPQISSVSFVSGEDINVASEPISITPEAQVQKIAPINPSGQVQAESTNNQVATNWALVIAIILAGLLILGGGLYWWYSREEDEI